VSVNAAPEDERMPPQPGSAHHPTEAGGQSGHPSCSEEQAETPCQTLRLFGVDQAECAHSWVVAECVTCDQAATVVADDSDIVETEAIEHDGEGADLLLDRDRGRAGESTAPRAGKVDDVARHMLDEMRKQHAERGAADRPSMHEQHVRSGPDPTMRNGAAGGDLYKGVGRSTEEVGSLAAGESDRHGALQARL
jgi:hypothetical protein